MACHYSWRECVHRITADGQRVAVRIVWDYTETTDQLEATFTDAVDYPQQHHNAITRMSWSMCSTLFRQHDFFGRQPRSRFLEQSNTLVISFPPYDMIVVPPSELDARRQCPTNENIFMQFVLLQEPEKAVQVFIQSVEVENATSSLLWMPMTALEEAIAGSEEVSDDDGSYSFFSFSQEEYGGHLEECLFLDSESVVEGV
jgi:hypothetical protein